MAKRILVIEDDPVSSRLMEYALEKQGYQVVTASNGLEGLKKVRAEGPDLVILDIMLPGMDGFEICHRVRSELPGKTLPILILSGKAQEADKATGLRLGADDYLVKPISPSTITTVVARLLASSDGQEESVGVEEKKSGPG